MKRGSKKNQIESNLAKDTMSFPPWVGWCWLHPPDSKSREDSSFSDEFAELQWVRRQLSKVVEVMDIACSVSEKLIAESRSTSSLPLSKVRLPSPGLPILATFPKTIFLASWNRSDPIERVTQALEEQYPEASLRVVLGQWWVGHRRTWPIATKWTCVYWYQFHDVVLPMLLLESEDWMKRGSTTKMALVVSDDSSIRRMWLEVLPRHDFQVLAASQVKGLPEGDVDVVFYEPPDNDAAGEIKVLRKTFPKAKIVACFSFPEWDQAKQCIDAGADIILGKPFQMEGLSSILADWARQG